MKKICKVNTTLDDNNNEIIESVFYGDYPSVKNGVKDLEHLSKDEIKAAIEFIRNATRCYTYEYHCPIPFMRDNFPDETGYCYC